MRSKGEKAPSAQTTAWHVLSANDGTRSSPFSNFPVLTTVLTNRCPSCLPDLLAALDKPLPQRPSYMTKDQKRRLLSDT